MRGGGNSFGGSGSYGAGRAGMYIFPYTNETNFVFLFVWKFLVSAFFMKLKLIPKA